MCTLNACEYDMLEMSDVQENIFTLPTDTIDKHNTILVCKKCGCQEAQISLKNKNKYCKMCFLTVLTHKFRATLGKSKLMQPSDSVLVAYSGKANSTVLLHLLKGNVNESVSKMLHFSFKVLYID
ncbi:Cytoplasmic tRNA 2-thiolation protein 2 B, partial [Eufriesea mexicana]